MAKTCMSCKIQQRDCPSCQAQSNTSGSGALRAHEYREAKKSRFDQTEADLVRTRVAHGMLMNELDASKKTNKKLRERERGRERERLTQVQ